MREAKQATLTSNGGTTTDLDRVRTMSERRPLMIVAGGVTAIGVAWAAAFTARSDVDPRVGITAWIAAAIVGTAATISAAKNS
jgi:hypothetical protein